MAHRHRFTSLNSPQSWVFIFQSLDKCRYDISNTVTVAHQRFLFIAINDHWKHRIKCYDYDRISFNRIWNGYNWKAAITSMLTSASTTGWDCVYLKRKYHHRVRSSRHDPEAPRYIHCLLCSMYARAPVYLSRKMSRLFPKTLNVAEPKCPFNDVKLTARTLINYKQYGNEYESSVTT